MVAISSTVFAQNKIKKLLTEADYSLWGNLNTEGITPDGNYISYSMSYESQDTLFVKNQKDKKTFSIPLGNAGQFGGNSWFMCNTPSGVASLINLKESSVEKLNNIANFIFINNAQKLVFLDKNGTLILRNSNGGTITFISNVIEYSYCAENNLIAYSTFDGASHTIGLLNTISKLKQTIIQDTTKFEKVVWKKDGKAFVVMQTGAAGKVRMYNLDKKRLYTKYFGSDMEISQSHYTMLKISADGQRVFFGVRKRNEQNDYRDKNRIQLWNTHDKWFYPAKIAAGGPNQKVRLALWKPLTDHFQVLTDDIYTDVLMDFKQQCMLTSDPRAYEPQPLLTGATDFYLTNLENGNKKLLLQNFSGSADNIEASPTGNFIAYKIDQDWFVYDLKSDIHMNLTEKTRKDEKNGPPRLFLDIAGWAIDNKEILLHDQNDIWKFNFHNGNATRITNGREKDVVFRYAPSAQQMKKRYNFDGFYGISIEGGKPILLSARNSLGNWQYYTWTQEKGIKSLMKKAERLSSLITSDNFESYAFLSENFENPPALFGSIRGEEPTLIYQSNMHHWQYTWGKSEHFSYVVDGTKLSGGLLFPANYNPKKKYPMIVLAYEKLSAHRLMYVNPSLLNLTGFNAANLTAQGYFILYPDIAYTTAAPGKSAQTCIQTAIDSITKRGIINTQKMGIAGHSFGGYETTYIITQSNQFAAAVAGAAITDFTSLALSSTANFNKPEFWRLEQDQFRMEKSLFENSEAYAENSPVLHAQNVTTPLLSWTGARDGQINKEQTMEFWFALWRLKKRNIMIMYPEEGHVLMKEDNQINLTKRVEAWFNHYLKGAPQLPWMMPNHNP